MADYGSEYKDAMSALNQMIAQQSAAASQKPSGILGNVDPALLGLAQGFLSPTKTGSFGESVGLGIAGAEGPLAAMKKQQLDAQNKVQELQLARAKLAMEAPYYQARASHLAGLGSGTGSSLASESVNLNRTWNILNNSDPEDLGMSEEEVAAAKQNVAKRLIELSQKGGGGKSLAGVASGADGQPSSSAEVSIFPEIKDQAGYSNLPPGTVFTYKGKQYTKPSDPNAPRG